MLSIESSRSRFKDDFPRFREAELQPKFLFFTLVRMAVERFSPHRTETRLIFALPSAATDPIAAALYFCVVHQILVVRPDTPHGMYHGRIAY